MRWNRTSSGVLAVLAALATALPANARGYCNADGVDQEQRKLVAEAAAAFYEGGGNLMGMLKAFEISDQGEIMERAEAAAGSFDVSAQAYRSAADAFSGHEVIKDIDYGAVAAMSGSASPILLASVRGIADEGAVALLRACSDKADALNAAVKEFQEKIGDAPRTIQFSELLNTFSEALSFGSIVSATFANAGGEKE